ncbi:TlpA family protein disulfide reductase [Persephonella sp.]
MKPKGLIFLLILLLTVSSCKENPAETKKIDSSHLLVDINGNPIPIPEDKLVVLNFMAYSCGACMKEIPVMKKVISQPPYRDKFQIIALVIDSEKGDLSDPQFPIYPNNRYNFVRFPVPGTPTTYIITPEGRKLVIIHGAVTEENFRKFLKKALEKAEKINPSL